MKQINVWFEEKEHEEISKIKDEHGGNWHDFIIDMIRFWKFNKTDKKEDG